MKYPISIIAILMSLAISVTTQTLSNALIKDRVNSLHAERSISIEFDTGSKMTKIMATSENFAREEAQRSGVLAMNFAAGLLYPGESFVKSPETFLLTFWVLTKKPRFGENHAMTVALRDEVLVIGSARYVAKPREQMEYLNFEISRENLTKIAGQTEVRFQLGDQEFTFTKSQMKLLADLLVVTDAG